MQPQSRFLFGGGSIQWLEHVGLFAQSCGARQFLPQQGKRPKATARQSVGELYSGLYAHTFSVPRGPRSRKKLGVQVSMQPKILPEEHRACSDHQHADK
ncbi:hypothetical protein ABIE35_001675 [Paenarthrobacter sp. 4246]